MLTLDSPDRTTEASAADPLRRSVTQSWILRVAAVPVVTTALFWPLLALSGVDVAQAGRVAVVIAIQAFAGALFWRLARGPVQVYLAESIGAGLALGTLMSLLAQQLLRVTPLGAQAWWLPAAVAVILAVGLAALPATRHRMRSGQDAPLTLDEVGAVALGVVVGLVFVTSFWRAHPLSWNGWWAYYVDIPYHEALSRSVTTWGPGENNLVVGSSVRYHWFIHAWAGTTTNASSAGAFVVMTRALPLVGLLGTVCLAWAWARRLSDRRIVPFLAVVLTTVAANVGNAHPVDYMHYLTISPSLGLAAVWLLGAALVFTEHVHRRLSCSLVFLALFTAGCMGGKTSNAAALVGALGLAALASLWFKDGRGRIWSAAVVGAGAALVAFVVVILGSSGNLRVEAGATARTLGLLPNAAWSGIVVGTVAAILVFAGKWVGVTFLLGERATSRRPEVWFGAGAALTGLFLMTVLGHPGQSQLYFPVSSGLIVAVVSAWGVGEGLRLLSPQLLTATLVMGVVAGSIAVSVGGSSQKLSLMPARLVGTGPYVVWFFVLAGAVGCAVWARITRFSFPRGALVSVFCLGLVTASIVVGQVAISDILRAPRPTGAAPNGVHAWTDAHAKAMFWLRDHSKQQDVVATNRQCTNAPVPNCLSTEFLTAALTDRRMYVEGADYAISYPHPAFIDQRATLSRRFGDAPTAADARVLWNAGVRWVVIDLASTHTRNWEPYAQTMFTTATTEILRLTQP